MTESPAQRSGTEYQAPSKGTSALRLTETGCRRRASNRHFRQGVQRQLLGGEAFHTRCGARRSTSPLAVAGELAVVVTVRAYQIGEDLRVAGAQLAT